MNRTAWLLVCLAAAALGFVLLPRGCGPTRPTTIPVTGQVRFEGQPPPAEGMIYFAPLAAAEGYPSRPGRGRFASDGRFAATTFEEGDGLLPGRYRVSFDCWNTPPRPEGPPSISYVPKPYGETSKSPLELTIKPDDSRREVEFDLREE